MKYFIICFLLSFSVHVVGQENASVSKNLSAQLLEDYTQIQEKGKRQFLINESTTFIQKVNPVRYFAGGLLFVYQNVFSEQISANCSYQISCSEKTKRSIQKYGFVKGTLIGLHQLSNCSGSMYHDHEVHAIDEDNKIINKDLDE